ncbi:hypothetical protein C8J57DRAFT_1559326 [Mycena rebaudengoi]|nr:hypothetical protein C8J57DRAFT_1559326 [Mycena rebaudengoi]
MDGNLQRFSAGECESQCKLYVGAETRLNRENNWCGAHNNIIRLNILAQNKLEGGVCLIGVGGREDRLAWETAQRGKADGAVRGPVDLGKPRTWNVVAAQRGAHGAVRGPGKPREAPTELCEDRLAWESNKLNTPDMGRGSSPERQFRCASQTSRQAETACSECKADSGAVRGPVGLESNRLNTPDMERGSNPERGSVGLGKNIPERQFRRLGVCMSMLSAERVQWHNINSVRLTDKRADRDSVQRMPSYIEQSWFFLVCAVVSDRRWTAFWLATAGDTGAMGNRIRSGRQFRRSALHWGPAWTARYHYPISSGGVLGPSEQGPYIHVRRAPPRGNLKNCKCTAAGGSGGACGVGWMNVHVAPKFCVSSAEILLESPVQQVQAMVEPGIQYGPERDSRKRPELHSVPGNMDCEVAPPFLAEARRESRKKVLVRVQVQQLALTTSTLCHGLNTPNLQNFLYPASRGPWPLFGRSNGPRDSPGIVRLQRLRRDCRLELGITFGALSTSASFVRMVKLCAVQLSNGPRGSPPPGDCTSATAAKRLSARARNYRWSVVDVCIIREDS